MFGCKYRGVMVFNGDEVFFVAVKHRGRFPKICHISREHCIELPAVSSEAWQSIFYNLVPDTIKQSLALTVGLSMPSVSLNCVLVDKNVSDKHVFKYISSNIKHLCGVGADDYVFDFVSLNDEHCFSENKQPIELFVAHKHYVKWFDKALVGRGVCLQAMGLSALYLIDFLSLYCFDCLLDFRLFFVFQPGGIFCCLIGKKGLVKMHYESFGVMDSVDYFSSVSGVSSEISSCLSMFNNFFSVIKSVYFIGFPENINTNVFINTGCHFYRKSWEFVLSNINTLINMDGFPVCSSYIYACCGLFVGGR